MRGINVQGPTVRVRHAAERRRGACGRGPAGPDGGRRGLTGARRPGHHILLDVADSTLFGSACRREARTSLCVI